MTDLKADLVIRGKRIAQDQNGYFSLSDMWKLSGEGGSKIPRYWHRLSTTRELVQALNSNVRFSHVWAKRADKSAIYSKSGNKGGTFAYIILALAYAEYLNPELGIEVREIALRVWAGDVSVLDEFNKALREQAQEDSNRVIARDEIRRNNLDLNALLWMAGARWPGHYADFHNWGYRATYGGLNEDDIHRKKGLKKGQAILDYMGFHELAANMFRTSLAQQRLRNNPVQSVMEACKIHKMAGERVRADLEAMGATMPEDMPTVDRISEAKKRLKNLSKLKARPKLK